MHATPQMNNDGATQFVAASSTAPTPLAQWKRLLNDLVKQLNDGAPSEEVLNQFEVEAREALGKTGDPMLAAGNMHVLALVATARKRADEARGHFSDAYGITREIPVLHNFAMAMLSLRQWVVAQPLFMELWRQSPDDVDRLPLLMNGFLQMGDCLPAIDIADRLVALKRPDLTSPELLEWIKDWRQNVFELGYTHEAISARWQVALQALNAIGIYPTGTGTCVADDATISLRFTCNERDPIALAKADFEIADALVNAFDDPLDRVVTFSTMSSYGR